MTSVTRYVGGPGTGKTTSLLGFLEKERDEHDTALKDIYFLTFTRSQRDDVRDRIAKIYPDAIKEDIEKRVRTIHGAALSELIKEGLIPARTKDFNPILREGKNATLYAEFADSVGLRYSSRVSTEPDNDTPQKYTGNIFFNISRYVTQQYTWQPEDWIWVKERTGETLPAIYDVPELLRKWADYKKERGYWEDDDYINLAVAKNIVPSVGVLVVDEFQDLSPSQYMLYRAWRDSGEISRIYIAGDPNQAIYGFRGADPAFLEKTTAVDRGAWAPGEVPQSHRCPVNIVATADKILGTKSNMTPKEGDGRVSLFAPQTTEDFVKSVEKLHRKYGKVLVLCRYRFFISNFATALSEAGIPCTGFSPNRVWGWEQVMADSGAWINMKEVFHTCLAIRGYQETGAPRTIPASVARDFAALLGVEIPPIAIHKSEIDTGVFISTLPGAERSILADVIPKLSIAPRKDGRDPRKYLAAAMQRDHTIKPGEVILDTIHASKGLQAPAVILHTGYLKKREIDYIRSPRIQGEERRVYYVGCTRASEALYFMDGLAADHPSAPPLTEAHLV